jgi:hypothetical protein
VSFDDQFAPELGQSFAVIIESIPSNLDTTNRDETEDGSWRTPAGKFVKELSDKLDGAKPAPANGRKIR